MANSCAIRIDSRWMDLATDQSRASDKDVGQSASLGGASVSVVAFYEIAVEAS